MTATEIVPCRMCKGREDVRAPIIRLWSPVKWVSCMTLGCRCAGPERTTEAEACASWNELMQPSAQASSEPKAGVGGYFCGDAMIPIDKGIPIPERKREGSGAKYNWRAMEVGGSFLMPADRSIADARANIASIEGRMRAKFLAAKTDEGIRVWRVE